MKFDLKKYQKTSKKIKLVATRLTVEDYTFLRKHKINIRYIIEDAIAQMKNQKNNNYENTEEKQQWE